MQHGPDGRPMFPRGPTAETDLLESLLVVARGLYMEQHLTCSVK